MSIRSASTYGSQMRRDSVASTSSGLQGRRKEVDSVTGDEGDASVRERVGRHWAMSGTGKELAVIFHSVESLPESAMIGGGSDKECHPTTFKGVKLNKTFKTLRCVDSVVLQPGGQPSSSARGSTRVTVGSGYYGNGPVSRGRGGRRTLDDRRTAGWEHTGPWSPGGALDSAIVTSSFGKKGNHFAKGTQGGYMGCRTPLNTPTKFTQSPGPIYSANW